MANYFASITWIDGKDKKYTEGVEMVRADEAAALTALQNYIEAKQVLTDAAPLAMKLERVVDFSGWTVNATPDANSDVEIQGLLVFRSGGVPRFYKDIMIPAFKENDYTVGKLIDLADADILALTGVVNGQGFATNHYEDLVDTVKGVKAFDGKAS